MRRATLGLFAFVVMASAVVACSFHVAGIDLPLSDLGIADGSPIELGPPDMSQCSTNGAAVGCNGDTLLVCMNGVPTPGPSCTDGCNTKGGAHCASLDPGGAALPADYLQPGLQNISLSATVTFFTDTGAIQGSPVSRGEGPGVDPSGIYYRLGTQADGSTVGIFSFASLTLVANATIQVSGNSPLVLLAAGDIDIEGAIDMSGSCMPGTTVAGGGVGGAAGKAGANPGASKLGGGGPGVATAGGGGGGGGGAYGDVGGAGGAAGDGANSGGTAGVVFGDLTVVDPILSGGGGGGGGKGGTQMMATDGYGGSGGGAIQIASNGAITFGATATINAGGCHGSGGGANGPGGGGGAGGAILIEGRTITLDQKTVLATNGAGGGGGGDVSGGNGDGADAMADDKKPNGGSSSSFGTNGGDGAAKNTTGGADVGNPSGNDVYGGGGGGAVGRIALKTKSGTVTGNGATFSPQIGAASPGPISPATEGAANFE